MRSALIAAAALVLAPGPLAAQSAPEAQPRPAATVADLEWLMGDWAGPGIGGYPAGESFSRVGDARMVGHFWQLDADGSPHFYELITIEPDGDSLVMRLKHFHADLTGWEGKEGSAALAFPLTARRPGEWVFGPVTFAQSHPDTLDAQVRVGAKDGSENVLTFDYRRLPPR